MTQANEIVTKPGSEISVVDLDINSVKIAELAMRCTNLRVDLKNDENYRLSQDVISEARAMRGQIKAAGTGLKEDAVKWQKKVIAEERRLDGEITEFLEPLAARKKVHDDAVKAEKERKKKIEQARKDTHLANINGIRLLISKAQNQQSSVIEQVIAELEAMTIDDSYEEYQKEAEGVHEDTDLALNSLLIAAQNVEEADRKRKTEDERLKKVREALEAEAAENERIKKENERVKKENDRQAAEIEEKTAEPAQEEQEEVVSSAAEDVTEQPAAEPTKVQKKMSDEQYAIKQGKDHAVNCLKESIDRYTDTLDCLDMFDQKECAVFVMSDITSMKIPGVTYSIL